MFFFGFEWLEKSGNIFYKSGNIFTSGIIITSIYNYCSLLTALMELYITNFDNCAQFNDQCQLMPCTSSTPLSQVASTIAMQGHRCGHLVVLHTNNWCPRNDDIMPTLRDTLHWLPVSAQCIAFIIVLIAHNFVADHQGISLMSCTSRFCRLLLRCCHLILRTETLIKNTVHISLETWPFVQAYSQEAPRFV